MAGQPPAPPAVETALPPQSIFLSYANDDAAAARALTDALRKRGLDVWLDKGETPDALKPETPSIAHSRADRQVRTLRAGAVATRRGAGGRLLPHGVGTRRPAPGGDRRGVPFLVPVRIDDVSYDESGIPQVLREKHWVEMPGGEANEPSVTHFVQTVRSESRTPAAGVAV